MRIVHLAAGAAGMYCGSCMHDNRLVATLRGRGRDVVLMPLYTPLRTDETDVSTRRVFYGGVNVYLQQVAGLFRHTPWVFDRLFDARPLLSAVGRLAGSTRAEDLGPMTRSVLAGAAGRQRKELAKLIAALRPLRPAVVHLPNLMFVGVARALKDALGVAIVCNLAGEDIFLDRFPEPDRTAVFDLIRQHAADVDAFVALSDHYARHATAHFSLPPERVRRLPLGIRADDFGRDAEPPVPPVVIGYLAHVWPAKGLSQLAEAFIQVCRAGHDCRLHAAGYLGPADREYLESVRTQLAAANLADRFMYVGEVSRAEKVTFLRSLHVFSVPAVYAESKGFYVLEALATGVPVVQPRHGAFPELLASTGGGLLYPPGDVGALADALASLVIDAERRAALGRAGAAGVRAAHTAEHVADAAWRLYEEVAAGRDNPRREGLATH